MDKKGASLSINIIVITIIVLVVLVIMILVFGRGITSFVGGTRSCEQLGGIGCAANLAGCKGYDDSTNLDGKWQYVVIPGAECPGLDPSAVCCKPALKIG